MACEAERGAFEEAKGRVRELRQAHQDYTGSDILGAGAPSGQHPEGTTEANQELEQVRQALEDSLEALTHARVALAGCTGRPVDYS